MSCPSCGGSIHFRHDKNSIGVCPQCGDWLIKKTWLSRKLEPVDEEMPSSAFDESDEWERAFPPLPMLNTSRERGNTVARERGRGEKVYEVAKHSPPAWHRPFLAESGLSRLMKDAFGDFSHLGYEEAANAGRIDIYEMDGNMVYEMELSGVERDELGIK